MTPPLTDAELLAYIERTPELSNLVTFVDSYLQAFSGTFLRYKRIEQLARAFHAHEQRVREEQIEACAKVCDALSADSESGERAGVFDEAAAAIRELTKQGGK